MQRARRGVEAAGVMVFKNTTIKTGIHNKIIVHAMQ